MPFPFKHAHATVCDYDYNHRAYMMTGPGSKTPVRLTSLDGYVQLKRMAVQLAMAGDCRVTVEKISEAELIKFASSPAFKGGIVL